MDSQVRRTRPHRRALAYWLTGAGLVLLYPLLRGSGWHGSEELHTLTEPVATLLALMVGVMALVRYYSRREGGYLIIGAGFLGTGLLDGYHALVTSIWFKDHLPSDLAALIPWSWVASRLFLSLLLVVSYLAWRREVRLGEGGRLGERGIYLVTLGATLGSFILFIFAPLPRAYYPEFPLHRPEELLPAALFLLALIGYLRKGAWRFDPFDHWLVLALVINLAVQVLFMPLSGELFDLEFFAAHLLKTVSYLCVLTGLLIGMYESFCRLEAESAARLRAEQRSRRECEERYGILFRNIPQMIFHKDRESVYVSCNDHYAGALGIGADAIAGKSDYDLYPRELAERYRADDRKVMDEGRKVEIEESWVQGEHQFWVQTVKVPIRDDTGQVVGLLGIFWDISERRRAQAALARSEETFNRAQAIAHIGSWDWDMPSNQLAWSDEIYRIFGLQPQGFAATYDIFLERVHPADRQAVIDAVNASVADADTPYRIKHRVVRPGGGERIVEEQGEVYRDDQGRPIRMIGTVHDITERELVAMELKGHREHLEELVAERTRELRDAQEALLRQSRLATLGQLTATVSHELRNPLGAMRPSVYLIRKRMGEGDPRLTEALDRIDRNIVRCDHIIDELLDFTRIQLLEPRSIPLDEWLGRLLDELAHGEGVTQVRRLGLPGVAATFDPDRLRRAVINVYENARQAMQADDPEAEGRPRALTVATAVRDSRIEITFADTGPGIEPDVLARVFEPLFSTKGFGVGLGLPTVQQIMGQHGGGIEITTTLGEGTQTLLWLPMGEGDGPVDQGLGSPEADGPSTPHALVLPS